MSPEAHAVLEKLSRDLADNGRLIEAGWVGLRITSVPEHAPQVQIDEMHYAFMAGAQHLFASIMTILDPDEEPTDADMHRMELIADELEAFSNAVVERIRTQGSRQ